MGWPGPQAHKLEDNVNQDIFCGFSGAAGSYLLALTKSAEIEYSISSEHLLQMCSLSPESLQHECKTVPVFYISSVIMQIVNLTKDEMVGLKLAKHFDLKAFDTLGYLLMHCETIGEGLARIQRFEKLVMEHSVTRISTENRVAQVSWTCNYDNESVRYFRELIVSGWISMVNRMSDHQLECTQVHFEHSNPYKGSDQESSALLEYEATFGCPVIFESEWTGVLFDEQYLNLPYGQSDPRLKAIMEEYAELMLSTLDSQLSFIHKAKLTLYRQLLNGETCFEDFAEHMHLSTRALQARFQKIGITYGELLDEIRRMLSLIYLDDPSISTLEVGVLLAYNDQSSFARAFKRWTGETPRQHRARLEHHKAKYADLIAETEPAD